MSVERRNEIIETPWHLLQLNESEFNFTGWFKCEKDDINDFYWNEAIYIKICY